MAQNHDLDKAKLTILSGGVIALPTETVYGLAASIHSEEGLRKIFSIKERPFFDPLIVHISDLDQKSQVISKWPDVADFLAKKFWPGPLTMVLPKNPALNSLITSGLDTVGLRLPSHPIARAIIDKCGAPLAAPSANKFGKTSPTKAEHVRKSFEKEDLFVLDGGQSEVGLESSVIRILEEDGKDVIELLRPGAVTAEMLEAALTERGKPFLTRRAESLASPGNLEHHYMPSIPLVIIDAEESALRPELRDEICHEFMLEPNSRGVELRIDQNAKIAARSLYGRLRECSESGAAFIYVFRMKNEHGGLWDAIWDRLGRASSKTYK